MDGQAIIGVFVNRRELVRGKRSSIREVFVNYAALPVDVCMSEPIIDPLLMFV